MTSCFLLCSGSVLQVNFDRSNKPQHNSKLFLLSYKFDKTSPFLSISLPFKNTYWQTRFDPFLKMWRIRKNMFVGVIVNNCFDDGKCQEGVKVVGTGPNTGKDILEPIHGYADTIQIAIFCQKKVPFNNTAKTDKSEFYTSAKAKHWDRPP